MTSKAALCQALLNGTVVNIGNIWRLTGYTNAAREIGRMIERLNDGGFGVKVSRTEKKGLSRYRQPVRYVEYRLNRTEYNKEGIKKMEEYVYQQTGKRKPAITEKYQQTTF